jgi:hypothetical protein
MASALIALSRFRNVTLLVSLLAFVLSGVLGASLILCIGGDGHISIESVDAPPHPAFVGHAEASFAAPESCVDRPVIELASSSPPKPVVGLVVPLFTLLCLLWTVTPPFGRFLGMCTAPRGRDPRLDHHRTVVLLN